MRRCKSKHIGAPTQPNQQEKILRTSRVGHDGRVLTKGIRPRKVHRPKSLAVQPNLSSTTPHYDQLTFLCVLRIYRSHQVSNHVLVSQADIQVN